MKDKINQPSTRAAGSPTGRGAFQHGPAVLGWVARAKEGTPAVIETTKGKLQ
jgi:hypothetical protein